MIPWRTRPRVTANGRQGLPATLAILVICAGLAACGSTQKTTSNPGTRGSRAPGTVASGTTTTIIPGQSSTTTVPPSRTGLPGRTYLPDSKAGSLSEVPVSTGPGANTSAVTVIKPDTSTLTALGMAFDVHEMLPSACADTIPGTVHVAEIKSTGEMWAISGFKPDPNCKILHDGQLITPTDYGPFGGYPPTPVGAFTRPRSGQWQMNTEVGVPFPCPPTPGQGTIVPEEVLKAWEIPYYSPTCVPNIPPPPP